MQRLCAFILFYLVIGCLSTSVYAEMYMWTDEKGIKHFSNTALNEQGKDIKQEGEIKFDEAKHQEILEQQRARIQAEADQKKASLREEYERELRKKFVQDAVYGVDRHYPLPPLQNPPRQYSPPLKIPESSIMQEWKMKNTIKDAVGKELRKDRLMNDSTIYEESGCTSDFGCGVGYKCVKAPLKSSGVCMKSVDELGLRRYNLPSTNSVGPNLDLDGQCSFDADCPIGFKCDRTYKTCIKK